MKPLPISELQSLPRPALRWHGGKWILAPWIISHFPAHRVYVEPFGGAASVLLRKPRAYAEIYNDLDDEVVNFFRVVRDPIKSAELVAALEKTPFARAEFRQSYELVTDPVEWARRLVVRSFMGFGSNAHVAHATGFRSNSNRSGTTPAHDWVSYPNGLRQIIERMSGVVIESRDAIAVMERHDSATTLHYVDPPYHPTTRNPGRDYRHEMDASDHERLLPFLRELRGFVVLSGYPHPLYDLALSDWARVERVALADGARKRTEVLWINPQCKAALDNSMGPLFEGLSA